MVNFANKRVGAGFKRRRCLGCILANELRGQEVPGGLRFAKLKLRVRRTKSLVDIIFYYFYATWKIYMSYDLPPVGTSWFQSVTILLWIFSQVDLSRTTSVERSALDADCTAWHDRAHYSRSLLLKQRKQKEKGKKKKPFFSTSSVFGCCWNYGQGHPTVTHRAGTHENISQKTAFLSFQLQQSFVFV